MYEKINRGIRVNKMKALVYTISLLFIVNYSSHANAKLIIDGSSDFKRKIYNNLSDAKNTSIYLAKLIRSIKASPSTITIKPITNDVSTWHKSGKNLTLILKRSIIIAVVPQETALQIQLFL